VGGRRSGVLDTVREKGSELVGRRSKSGLLLLRDLRKLYMLASEAFIIWVIFGQGARAAKDHELLRATTECHPDTSYPQIDQSPRSRRPPLRCW
jgi:hypothetical protein